MRRTGAILVLPALALALAGCDLLLEHAPPVADAPGAGKGHLQLTLGDVVASARTLAPPIVMQIGSYDIRGQGPDLVTDYFESLDNTSGYLALGDLSTGLWTIRVEARNPYVEGDPHQAGTIIGHGETQVTIEPYAVTSANVVIRPLPGTGTLQLSMTWTRDPRRKASIEATLTPVGGAPIGLPFTLTPEGNADTGVYPDPEAPPPPELPAGYYILMLRLLQGGTQVWGTVEAVRIVEGQVTTGTWGLN